LSEGIRPGASIDTVSSSGNHTISSGDLQAIEPAEILRLLLKECPLEAIVVGGKGTSQSGHRIQPKSVECFDPKIKVAIGLRPDPLARMTEM
jgi:hypothetical protein